MTVLVELINEMEKWPYSATPYIIKTAKDLKVKDQKQRENIIVKTINKIKNKMETDKIHQRVLEIQKNIETADTNQQKLMLSELIDMVSKIEQSLSEVKVDINDIENQINENK